MNERVMAKLLRQLLLVEAEDEVRVVEPAAGGSGLVVGLHDGSEFLVTVEQRKATHEEEAWSAGGAGAGGGAHPDADS
jgi:hypothetical protein